MENMLEKLKVLQEELTLKKKELENKKKSKEDVCYKIGQEQYDFYKVKELELELESFENDKKLINKKTKHPNFLKIKNIINILLIIVFSYALLPVALIVDGIGLASYLAFTAGSAICLIFEYMYILEYSDEKEHLNRLNLDDIESKIEEIKNKIKLEKEKKIENKNLKKLQQEGNVLQEQIDNIVKEINELETLISEIISKYDNKNSNFVNLEKDLSKSKVKELKNNSKGYV